MNRTQQRQLARVVGWRGSKSKRPRRYLRPEFRPYEEPTDTQTAEVLAARQDTTTTR